MQATTGAMKLGAQAAVLQVATELLIHHHMLLIIVERVARKQQAGQGLRTVVPALVRWEQAVMVSMIIIMKEVELVVVDIMVAVVAIMAQVVAVHLIPILHVLMFLIRKVIILRQAES